MSGDNLKAVAGMSGDSREMPFDDDEEEVESAPPHYLPVIQHVCEKLEPSIAAAIKETPCFGHLWEDEAGVCPEADDCHISSYCASVYSQVNDADDAPDEPEESEPLSDEHREAIDAVIDESVQQAMDELVEEFDKHKSSTGPGPEEPPEESLTTPGALADTPRKKKKGTKAKQSKRGLKQKTKRGKYKGTGKYDRHGYVSMGRPVDYVVQRLEHELGYPFELPKSWSYASLEARFGDKGRILIAKTASYHAIIVDYKMICRVWTNAAGYALCDLSPLLVAKLNTLKVPVEKIPPGSKNTKKYKYFEGRYYLTSVTDADNLAKWILEAYKLKTASPPKKKPKKKKTMSRKGKTSA